MYHERCNPLVPIFLRWILMAPRCYLGQEKLGVRLDLDGGRGIQLLWRTAGLGQHHSESNTCCNPQETGNDCAHRRAGLLINGLVGHGGRLKLYGWRRDTFHASAHMVTEGNFPTTTFKFEIRCGPRAPTGELVLRSKGSVPFGPCTLDSPCRLEKFKVYQALPRKSTHQLWRM